MDQSEKIWLILSTGIVLDNVEQKPQRGKKKNPGAMAIQPCSRDLFLFILGQGDSLPALSEESTQGIFRLSYLYHKY